jgi:hypothetical protein
VRVAPVACVLAAVLMAGAPTGRAEVRVRLSGNRVDLEATNAPLSEILAALAEKTGMKVVYDGQPPRTPLTTTLASRAQPEAVLALFEGLGLNFALSLDPTGARVETLLVVAASGARAATAPARGAAPVARPTPPPEDPATEGEPEEPPPMEAGPPEPGSEAPSPAQPPDRGQGPFQPGMRPGSPFDLRPAPLTFPTPLPASPLPTPPPAEPAPEPTPTPPGR